MPFWKRNAYKDYFCASPFEDVVITEGGDVRPCSCAAWLDTSIGNLTTSHWPEIWNSPTARRIRASMHEGSFSYCNAKLCPHLLDLDGAVRPKDWDWNPLHRGYIDQRTTEVTKGPRFVVMSYDPTCNLTCPGCRSKHIVVHGDAFERLERMHRRVVDEVLTTAQKVCCAGQGEPFASRVYLDFLQNFDYARNPGLTVELTTNGQLVTPKNWASIANSHHAIKSIHVSVNAGSAVSYPIVQRGGEWETLLENLAFIRSLREQGRINEIRFGYYVQENNFHELPNIIRLAREFTVDIICLGVLQDWGVYAKREFQALAVCDSRHPRHAEFLRVMQMPELQDPIVEAGNLGQFIQNRAPQITEPLKTWDDLVRVVSLREDQLDDIKRRINELKDRACELQQTPDHNGATGIDRFLEAARHTSSGAGDSEFQSEFRQYMRNTLAPGTRDNLETVYRKLAAQCHGEIVEALGVAQARRFQMLGAIDLVNLDTGYDPRAHAIYLRRRDGLAVQ